MEAQRLVNMKLPYLHVDVQLLAKLTKCFRFTWFEPRMGYK